MKLFTHGVELIYDLFCNNPMTCDHLSAENTIFTTCKK